MIALIAMASALLLLISSISCLPEREQLTEATQSDLRLEDIVVPAGFVMTTTRLVQVSMEGAIAETLRDTRLVITLPNGKLVFQGDAEMVAKGVLFIPASFFQRELTLDFSRNSEVVVSAEVAVSDDGKAHLSL